MMRVVLASRNEGKLKELQAMLEPQGLQLESQASHNVPSAEETGSTFIENALIKARSVCAATGLAAIADDSGLVVRDIGGEPGIYSARYAGEEATDADNNAKLIACLLEKQHDQLNPLDRVEKKSQGGAVQPAPEILADAYFYCAIVHLSHADDPTPVIATGRWHGAIVAQPRGRNGFGYDPHFLVRDLGKTSAELLPDVKNQLSHRGQAIVALTKQLAHAG